MTADAGFWCYLQGSYSDGSVCYEAELGGYTLEQLQDKANELLSAHWFEGCNARVINADGELVCEGKREP